ncbi:hypothetical protein [Paenibacillus eucommiae]|uniref:Neck protein n=1 Tax=Paenibacillus eucommiae TaxID=1355755 RepID=A0ABS4IYX0_9BACL|nr:hypothetical protein [Paenibacillus eucommiae]MBP1992728.1 hypothetical protein [Paenibacillus eucommiae]
MSQLFELDRAFLREHTGKVLGIGDLADEVEKYSVSFDKPIRNSVSIPTYVSATKKSEGLCEVPSTTIGRTETEFVPGATYEVNASFTVYGEFVNEKADVCFPYPKKNTGLSYDDDWRPAEVELIQLELYKKVTQKKLQVADERIAAPGKFMETPIRAIVGWREISRELSTKLGLPML